MPPVSGIGVVDGVIWLMSLFWCAQTEEMCLIREFTGSVTTLERRLLRWMLDISRRMLGRREREIGGEEDSGQVQQSSIKSYKTS